MVLVSVSPRTQYVRPTALSPNAPFVIAFRPSSRLPPSRNRSRYPLAFSPSEDAAPVGTDTCLLGEYVGTTPCLRTRSVERVPVPMYVNPVPT